MRAMLLEKPRPAEKAPLQLAALPEPLAGPNEVRVCIHCCGLCHTDLHTVEGDLPLPKLPLVPGHQIVGTIDAIGANVRTLKAGDRVGIPWLHSTDGTCPYCQRHTENLCEHAQFTGYHVHGGYAEFCVIREDFAHPLPTAFTDENAAPLLCAGVIGYRSYRLSGAQKGHRLGLYGFGASAHLVLQLARYQGCDVYVFTRGRAHRELAEKLGAVWTGGAEETPPHPLDASIIFAPAGALVLQALGHLRKAGTLALAGITMTQIPPLDYNLLYHERVLRSVANSTREDCREFLRLAAEIPVHTEIRVYPLAEANRALQDLKQSKLEAAGVLRIAESPNPSRLSSGA
jgi:propanol-preferring alcohol dehydrogenase